MAALVNGLDASGVALTLVNLNPVESRDVVVQAGTFGEHRFRRARYSAIDDPDDYPGSPGRHDLPSPISATHEAAVDEAALHVHLPPATRVDLELAMDRYVHRPRAVPAW